MPKTQGHCQYFGILFIACLQTALLYLHEVETVAQLVSLFMQIKRPNFGVVFAWNCISISSHWDYQKVRTTHER